MKILVVLLILTLCVLHHDVWWWDSPAPIDPDAVPVNSMPGVVFGFMPIGLAWHTGISLGAGLVWTLAVLFCWPALLDDESADEGATQ